MSNSLSSPLRRGDIGSTLSIGAKGLILVAIPVLCQLLVLGLLRQSQNHGLEAERWAARSKRVIAETDEVYRLMVQAVANQRAAAITANPNFDAALTAPPGAIARRLEALSSLISENPTQEARMQQLRADGGELDAWCASQLALVRAGRAEEAAERIRAAEGRDRMTRIDATMTAFLAEERRIDAERVAAVRADDDRARFFTTLAAVTSLLVGGVLAYVFSRSVSARLETVTTNAARLAASAPLAEPVVGTDEIARLDGVLHDTARRLSDAAASTAEAHAEIARRAEELATVNRELNQQTQENELFIYSVSHDLRSPLVNLQGFSKELVRSCEDLRRTLKDDAVPAPLRERVDLLTERDVPESIHFIRTAVTRASAIIDALLRLSRVGRVEYLWQPVNLSRTLRNVRDAMQATIQERRAEIVLHPLAPAWGDPTALEQVFANLVGNAVNYLDPERPGRVEVGMAEAHDPTIAARGAATRMPGVGMGNGPATGGSASAASGAAAGEPAFDDPRFEIYYVRDNGLGIPAASIGKVFVAFQRLHAQRARGEGIGLAVVRRIIERHRGRIWVESIEGVGSTFFVMLPRDAAAAGLSADIVPDPQDEPRAI